MTAHRLKITFVVCTVSALYLNFPIINHFIPSKMSNSWVFQQNPFKDYFKSNLAVTGTSNNKNTKIDSDKAADLTVENNVNSVIKIGGGVLKMLNSKNCKINGNENEFEVNDCSNCKVSRL